MLLQRPSQTVLHLGLVRNISDPKKETIEKPIKKSNDLMDSAANLERIIEGDEEDSEKASSPQRSGDRGGSPGRSTRSPSKAASSRNIWNLISSELRKAGKSKVKLTYLINVSNVIISYYASIFILYLYLCRLNNYRQFEVDQVLP